MKKQNGFSLIEILVVLVIMGLLISVVAPTVLNSADDARVQKVQADFKAIETALKIYRLDNYVYPSTEQGLVALVEPSTLEPEPATLKRGLPPEVPMDPWGREYSICLLVNMVRSIFTRLVQMVCLAAKTKVPTLAIGVRATTPNLIR